MDWSFWSFAVRNVRDQEVSERYSQRNTSYFFHRYSYLLFVPVWSCRHHIQTSKSNLHHDDDHDTPIDQALGSAGADSDTDDGPQLDHGYNRRQIETSSSFQHTTKDKRTKKSAKEEAKEKRDKRQQGYKNSVAASNTAYVSTTIAVHAISYAMCYRLVDHVLHVGTFLERIGISKAGNFVVAYVAYKETRIIPIVLAGMLAPVVEKWIRKEPGMSPDGHGHV